MYKISRAPYYFISSILIDILYKKCGFSSLFSATMSRPHPGRQRGFGGTHLLDEGGDVWDWAPPGWHWEVLPSGARSLVRNPGPVVDPDLVWWHSRGPRAVQREPAPQEVVLRRIWEENDHVRRYVELVETMYTNTWSFLQRDPNPYMSFDPVRVPWLWMRSACGSPATRRRRVG